MTPQRPPPFQLFGAPAFWRIASGSPGEAGHGINIYKVMAIAALATWLPLFVLALAQGVAVAADAQNALLLDVAMYARFVIALPLLIYAPSLIDARLGQIVDHFQSAGFVRESDRAGFVSLIASTLRRRDMRGMDIACLALAYAYALIYAFAIVPNLPSSWRTVTDASGHALSLAGWWYVLVSQPIYVFVLIRFFYRLGLWWFFLNRISQLNLHLNSAHPDHAAGLGFLTVVLRPFRMAAFAMSLSAAGGLANLVLFANVRVADYTFAVLTFAAIVVAAIVAPLLFFNARLAQARRLGIFGYGTLVDRQLTEFEQKWVGARNDSQQDLLRSPDFSAVIDLNATSALAEKRKSLIERSDVGALIVASLLPFVPVVALELPVEELLRRLKDLLI